LHMCFLPWIENYYYVAIQFYESLYRYTRGVYNSVCLYIYIYICMYVCMYVCARALQRSSGGKKALQRQFNHLPSLVECNPKLLKKAWKLQPTRATGSEQTKGALTNNSSISQCALFTVYEISAYPIGYSDPLESVDDPAVIPALSLKVSSSDWRINGGRAMLYRLSFYP
jgi:hypothetical protein